MACLFNQRTLRINNIENKLLLKLSKTIFASNETEVKVLTSLMPSYETCLCNDHFLIIQNTCLKMLINHLKVIMDSLKDTEIQLESEESMKVLLLVLIRNKVEFFIILPVLKILYFNSYFFLMNIKEKHSIHPSDNLINILHFIHSIEAVGIILPNGEGLRSKICLINVEN